MSVETKQKTETNFFTDITATVKNAKDEPLALAPVVEKQPAKTLLQTINRLAGRGINFDVSENEFTISGKDLLTASEWKFIEANRQQILCTLQQGVLVCEVFARDEQKLREFEFDVAERQAIIAQSEPDERKIYSNAVQEVTRQWFGALLEQADDSASRQNHAIFSPATMVSN